MGRNNKLRAKEHVALTFCNRRIPCWPISFFSFLRVMVVFLYSGLKTYYFDAIPGRSAVVVVVILKLSMMKKLETAARGDQYKYEGSVIAS